MDAAERIALLDVLRGFALFGVLLSNMVTWFSGRFFLPRSEWKAKLPLSDQIAVVADWILINGKSLALLTCLFGVGFAVQLARAEARGASGASLHLRRMAALFSIGVAHVVLLWWGDILMSYAMAGVFLLFFRKISTRALLIWAAFLLVVPRLVAEIPAVAAVLEPMDPHRDDFDAFRARLLAAMRGSDHVELARMQLRQAVAHVAPGAAWYFPWVLGRLLLGFAVGRSGLLQNAGERRPFLRKLLAWGLVIGITGTAVTVLRRLFLQRNAVPLPAMMALEVLDEASVLALAAAYLAGFSLLMARPGWQERLLVLQPVGRMALTTYLSQSLVCTFLFYGWGLGLITRVGAAPILAMGVAIFTIQVAVSGVWMRRFRFGPMEWIWRTLAYGRRPAG